MIQGRELQCPAWAAESFQLASACFGRKERGKPMRRKFSPASASLDSCLAFFFFFFYSCIVLCCPHPLLGNILKRPEKPLDSCHALLFLHRSHISFFYEARMAAAILLPPLVQVVLEKSVSAIQRGLGKIWGVDKELARLQSALSLIQATLQDVEENQATDRAVRALNDWIAKLKDAAYDADNILDEVNYEALRREAEEHGSKMIKKVQGFFSFHNSLMFRFRMAQKIAAIVGRMDDIAAEQSKFVWRNGRGGGGDIVTRLGETDRLQTHSFISESEVIAREEDKMKIVELLISRSGSRSATVVPIFGIGGLGKTTLAQMVYNDERVVQHFHKQIWVCVSDDFDVRKIVRAIIESATNKKCKVSDMDPLQKELREILRARRFLLVLDDVWNENEEKWCGLKDLLTVGADGSSVMVTTRSKIVSSIVGTVEAYQLAPLSEQDCWILFKKRAFESTEEPQKLATIGKQIVKKCGGLPLAAKTLGSLMRLKSEEWEWRSVMQSEIWELRDDRILPSLKLSYNHLPSHLKQCFSYCAIFPKDYEIDKDMLIQLWMANGLIPTQGNMEFEEKGHEIFTELAWRCFFQEVKEIKRWYDSDTKTTCKMHDLMHDLASSIMGNECRIFDNPESISNRNSKIRHLSINYFADLSNIDTSSSAKTLRTLLLLGHGALVNPHSRATLSKNMYLRVLDLSYTSISDCHISMERFKLLRYLDISFSDIETLPENICSLICLQTLKLIHCEGLLQLPRGMRNMTNLRHLYLDGCYSLRCMPKGMGHLKHLRTLTRYILGNESGSGGIGELKNLNLQGMLELCNLENVNSEEDARDVNLGSKHYLRVLKLDWGMSADRQEEGHVENVLEALQPPHSLKKFTLQNYRGAQFPAWLRQDPMLLNSLVEIIMTGCNRCEHLPQLGQLPFLEILEIGNMNSVRYMGGTSFYGSAGTDQNSTPFPSLRKIRLHNMDNLEEWEGIRGRPSFPQLASLKISSCSRLRNIPLFPTTRNLEIEYCSALLPAEGFFGCMNTLERLEMRECHELTLLLEQEEVDSRASLQELTIRGCQKPMFSSSSLGLWKKMNSLQSLSVECCDGLNFLPVEVLQGLSSLKCLRICYCRNLIGSSSSEFDGGLQLQHLTSLEKLAITGCEQLANLPQDSLKHLSTLKVIELGGFQDMTILPDFPQSLLQAIISKCPNVCSLPAGLGCCTALVCLRIQDLPNLSSLPEGRQGLNALEELTITDCPKLISLPNSLLPCPRNLKCLWVKNCPELETQCMRGGEYWGFVSDIPVRSMMAAVEHDNRSSSRGQRSRLSMIGLQCCFVESKEGSTIRSRLQRH
ncbi:putative disease resistance protein RGA3 [Phoenix dactylifera]|uniref:Disease resistance protein RGA3 n=1 Tax=Phoenix dactylifera TaxID=42345 RepID=A0A8B8ZGU4_PHODC|nr:putative disease resistance protein RGA3 [Phoenix dactylifera]